MSYLDKKRLQHVDSYLEDSKLFHYRDLDFDRYKVKRYFYKDLGNVDLKGYYPFASEYVDKDFNPTSSDKGELLYYFLPVVHEMYIGTTGSGKTTGCVEPQLRAVSSLKHRPNLFFTDPKGELFERNAKHLKSKGYKIFSLNFKDVELSNRWNPLYEAYDENQKVHDIKTPSVLYKTPVSNKFIKYNDDDEYGEIYYVKDNIAFATKELVNHYIDSRLSSNRAKVQDLVNEFSSMVVQVRRSHDPTWEEGAQRLFSGFIYAMLEDSLVPEYNFTRDMMSLKTLKDLYTTVSANASSYSGNYDPTDFLPFKHKRLTDYSMQLMGQILNSADNTRRGYMGVFDTSTEKWFNHKILQLTLDDTINLDDIGDSPFAIFLITRDYEKNDFLVAGLFIDWLYRKMIERSEKTNSPKELHFILDEFGNIPAIRDFENKIATSRSRNIWFHLVVQSYSQIGDVYDYTDAGLISNVIIDNCNGQIFLGSQHHPTRERFSKECGQHSILSFDSYIKKDRTNFVTVPLVPLSRLDNITPGEIYVKRTFMPVIKSSFVRSYLVKEFKKDNFDGFSIIDKKAITLNIKKYTYTPPQWRHPSNNIYRKDDN